MKFKKDDLIRGINCDTVGDAVIQVTAITGSYYQMKWIYPDQDSREGQETHEFIDERFKSVPEWYLIERMLG